MKTEQQRILDLLEQGKVSASEADQLLKALEKTPNPQTETTTQKKATFLKVDVQGAEGDPDAENVNIKIPLKLIESGMKLKGLLPEKIQDKVNSSLKDNGIDFDLSQVNKSNLDEFITHLTGMSIDVSGKRENVRIYCD